MKHMFGNCKVSSSRINAFKIVDVVRKAQ